MYVHIINLYTVFSVQIFVLFGFYILFNITNLWPMLIIYAYIDIHVYNRTYKPSTRCHGKVVLQ